MSTPAEKMELQQPTASRVIPPHPELQANNARALATAGQVPAVAPAPPAPAPNPDAEFFGAIGRGDEPAATDPRQDRLPYHPDWDRSRRAATQPQTAPAAPAPSPVTPPQQELEDIDRLLQEVEPTLPGAPAPSPQPQAQPQAAPPPGAPPVVDMAALQKQAIDHLMANEYKMDDALSRRVISEPEAVLPEIAARVHVNVVRDMGQRFAQMIPQMIDQAVSQRMAAQSAELEFYGKYPALNRPEFRGTVVESLTMIRNMMPNASREELMREGATLAAHRIRSSYRGRAPAPQPRAAVTPYQPVPPGGGAPVPTRPQEGSLWAQLADDPNLLNF